MLDVRKRGRPRLQLTPCACGYFSQHNGNLKKHMSICQYNYIKDVSLLERVASLERQLMMKDQQLSEKDKHIAQLIKRPRTVNNHNRFVLNNNVNCFGRESLNHIPEAKYQELLRDPETSVAKVVALQRSVAENENVTVPNVRERRWLVVEDSNGEKQWRSKDKGAVLEQIWESGTCLLEGEADEKTIVGARWSKWADKVRSEMGGGKLYREQLDMVEHCILDKRNLSNQFVQDDTSIKI